MSLEVSGRQMRWRLRRTLEEGTPIPHPERTCFQIFPLLLVHLSQSIMAGYEQELRISFFHIAICGADCGINSLCLCRLDLIPRNLIHPLGTEYQAAAVRVLKLHWQSAP